MWILCSTGWITHWGEKIANTSSDKIVKHYKEMLEYNGGWGSVNLYVVHGGTNFGWWAGEGLSALIDMTSIHFNVCLGPSTMLTRL